MIGWWVMRDKQYNKLEKEIEQLKLDYELSINNLPSDSPVIAEIRKRIYDKQVEQRAIIINSLCKRYINGEEEDD